MHVKLMELRRHLAKARKKLADDLDAQEEVKVLLAKADERRISEPHDARKWNKVLESLEKSLDQTKARCLYAQIKVQHYEQACEALEAEIAIAGASTPPANLEAGVTGGQEEAGSPTDVPPVHGLPPEGEAAEKWSATLERVGALNLEEASQLQSQIDAGEVQDDALEAGLALANQIRRDAPAGEGVPEPRRQHVLRAAIDKVSKQAFDTMTVEEIKLLMACHTLLTSRLEPSMRDQRLRRILDGAIKILQKKKESMEKSKPAT